MITLVGASGNVGSKVAAQVLAAGKKMRLIARHADNLRQFEAKGAELFIGDSADADFLTSAFSGSEIVVTMIPTILQAEDAPAYQDRLGQAQVEAIQRSGVKKVIHLSSLGAHDEENSGIIAGLARQEKRYNALEGVNVLHLRPTYYMENHLSSLGMILGMGINGGALLADKAFPMIATRDIADEIAELLLHPFFAGKEVRSLIGPRDYTLKEATAILGASIGKPDLAYVQFPYEDAKHGMTSNGISASVADAYIGMMRGGNEAGIWDNDRSGVIKTSTSLETFAEEIFAPAFHAATAVA